MLASKLGVLIDEQALQSQDPEDCYITSGVSWQQYDALLAKLEDSSGLRVTYLDGVLEILSSSRRHESEKTRIGTLLEIYFLETETEYFPLGSTTIRTEAKEGGVEPDEGYCIGKEKAFPDLAVEVIATSDGVDKLAVYSRLRVPEVWSWQKERFSVYRLRERRPLEFSQTFGYESIAKSELLHKLDVALLAECVRHPNSLAAVREFRDRLREKLG